VRSGRGRLLIEGEERIVAEGDCALIPPGARRKVYNVGSEPLRIVCPCSPAYSDEDTCLTECAPWPVRLRA
jgi:mannose-6-phosphate isomerase-like protein (cupin superfamily)